MSNLIKLDFEGNGIWGIGIQNAKSLPIIFANGGLYLAGTFSEKFLIKDRLLIGNHIHRNDAFLVNLSLDGELIWLKRFGGPPYDGAGALGYLPKKNHIVLAGGFEDHISNNNEVFKSKGQGDIYIAQISDTLRSEVYNSKISGQLYIDKNSNCLIDEAELGLGNRILRIEPGDIYTMSDEQGKFNVKVPYGNLTITPLVNATPKYQTITTCLENIKVSTDSLHEKVANVNFGYQIKNCSALTIDISADRRRRCFRSKTTVTYTNEGAADAQNVKIKVIYPKYVIPLRSTQPWTSKKDSVLLFDIGFVKAGERKSFVITDSTICGNELIRGLSQCVKAFISPKSSCISPDQNWDESSLVVEANLTEKNRNATFTLANEGEKDMRDSTTYRLYANSALVKKGKVKLAKGSKTTLEVPMKAATLRLEADQVPNHPGESRPNASIQPPVIVPSMAVPPTPIQDAYQDDADAEVSISCLNIIDSYDPNDKQVTPQGITKRHYIKPEDKLQYLIRFQNTGTDTAFTVVVKDTLSQFVDIASLQVGSASHPFTYTVSGKGKPVLTFTFKNINLPDFKRNEPASHGYVKFIISQTPNNPKATIIKNKAYNYFDYNSPIATNETFNIIGDTTFIPAIPTVVYDCGKENPTPAVAGADINLCEGSEVTLQANTPAKGLGQWKVISGQATIINPESPTSAVQNIGYGETILEWTITLCQKTATSQLKINRYSIPAAPVVRVPAVQCEGKALASLVATGSNITWYQDEGKQQKLFAGNNYVPQITTTTTFYATQSINGCESPVSSVVVNIHPARVSFSSSGDTLVAQVADQYQWYFNGKLIKDAVKQKYTVRNTGEYSLRTMTQGCESQSALVRHTINAEKARLQISPNPAANKLQLELQANETGLVRLLIYDRLGRKVAGFTAEKPYTILENTLNLSDLKAGLYYLEVQLGKTSLKQKFVKL